MADTEDTLFKASILDDTRLFFDNLDRNLNKAEKSKAFDRLQAKVNKFGKAVGKAANSRTAGLVAIGASAGAALLIVNQLVDAMGRGVQVVAEFAAGGAILADRAESARINFTNILGGNEDAALAFMDQMNKKALSLGVSATSLTAFSKSLLPDASSVAEFEKLVEAAVTLDKSDPDKTIDDVRFAFEEALSGNFRSLIQRFDLPKAVAENARKAIEEGASSVGGLLAALEKEFERTGINIESQQGTMSSMMAKTSAELEFLQAKFGEPIKDAFKPILETIKDFLENNREDLQLFAASLGDILAKLVALADVNIKGLLDFEPEVILETADAIGDIVTVGVEFFRVLRELDKAAGDLMGVLSGAPEPIREVGDATSGASGAFEGFVESLIEATITAAKFKAVIVGLKVFLKTWGDIDAAQRAADEAFAESTRSLVELKASLDDNNKTLDERRKNLNKSTEAEWDFIQALLSEKDALKKLEKQQEIIKEADQVLIRLRTQLSKRLIGKEIEASRARFDLEKRESRRREDLAKSDAETRLEITDNALSDRLALLEGSDTDTRSNEKNAAKESVTIEKDKRDDLIALEKRYRQELTDIQNAFQRSATEAQISNDVQAFLSAKRTRDDNLKDAKKFRDVEERDIVGVAKEQQKEIKASLIEQRNNLDKNLQEQLALVDKNAKDQTAAFDASIEERGKAHKLLLDREAEDRKLNLKRQEEDLIRSLQDQLSALKGKYGEFIDVTAEGLLTQSKEYLDTYGPQGNVDGVMDDFFKRQQERLAEFSESRTKVIADIKESEKKIADLERKNRKERSAVGKKRLGGEEEGGGAISSSSPLFLPIIEKRGRVGQAGLVSEFLANSTNRISPVTFSGGGSTVNNNRSDVLTVNMQGVEPYLQRVATQAALEIFRNVTAGGRA